MKYCEYEGCQELLGLRNKSGLCKKHYNMVWEANHREERNEWLRQWHKNNPGKRQEFNKKYYDTNREEIIGKNVAAVKANPENSRRLSREWIARNPEQHYQSGLAWKRANPEKARATRRKSESKRNAIKKQVFVEDVDYDIVFERDQGICHLCYLLVEGDWELDHIIPLSLLGPHCYANVAVSHPSCNASKNNRFTSPNPFLDAAARQSFKEFHGYEFVL